MDHVVYLDTKAGEMEALLDGRKTMILRGAAGRKLPYGRVEVGDMLYFIRNNGEGIVRARAEVSWVLNSEKMDKAQSVLLAEKHQEQLQLTPVQHRRWAGKRYLVLVQVQNVAAVEPFSIDKSDFGNMDDWLPVEAIQAVRV